MSKFFKYIKSYYTIGRRVYQSQFNIRDMEIIIKDYYNNRWISKDELERLFEYEKKELLAVIIRKDEDYSLLINGFNLNALQNYELLERKFQNQLKS